MLAKVREKDDKNNDDDVCSDRISRLPDPVLHHILCFLSQKKTLQTCVLSKSWRHLGPTRPVIDLRRGINGVCENSFKGNQEAFISFVDNTFQRYQDHNLFPKELRIDVRYINSQSTSVLQKWIPKFLNPDKHVTTFSLSFGGGSFFNLPSVVFKVESLQQLSLQRCCLKHDNFSLKNLQKLSLSSVYVSDGALENMISSCPLVKCILLLHCQGFKTINIGIKNRCLNRFEFSSYSGYKVPSIDIEAPTLESIRVESGNSNWYPNNTNRNYFPHLKTLFLSKVKLPTHSFDINFSCNFPCLEDLTLLYCFGFEEINISSRSITRLIINQLGCLPIKKLAIDVPNILYFQFSYKHFPTTISLAATSTEWKSSLKLYTHEYAYGDGDVLPRILKLFEMVKALSQSQISLTIYETYYFKINKIEWDFNDHPVEVENLGLKVSKFCPDSFTHFVNALFRIFRPRYTNAVRGNFNNDDEVLVTAFLWKTLIHEREKTEYGWEQHLKDVSIEASDDEGKVWHHVQLTCLPEWSKNQKIRFRLKWKD